MEKLSPGQIHLADQRGFIETETLQRYSSLNYGNYFSEHRKPFGRLSVSNDETLACGKSTTIEVKNTCYVVVIPITGELLLKIAGLINQSLDVGQVYVHHASHGDVLELVNPYENDWINYLYFFADENNEADFDETFNFDLADKSNQLIAIIAEQSGFPFRLSIGQFAGRVDALYHLKNKNSLFYAFVIAGAFELQGRLMHQRDGLALWEQDEVDLEALSNNAVILILEMFE